MLEMPRGLAARAPTLFWSQAQQKGHGNSVHRLAMTSILKRDWDGPALPACRYGCYRPRRLADFTLFCRMPLPEVGWWASGICLSPSLRGGMLAVIPPTWYFAT